MSLRHSQAIELLQLLAEEQREAAADYAERARLANDTKVFPGLAGRALRKSEALLRGAAALKREERVYTTPLVFAAPGTAEHVKSGAKDVTRRLAAPFAAPRWKEGALARAFERSPRAGGQPFGEVRIVSVRREKLSAITDEDVKREGFPELDRNGFCTLFRELHRGDARGEVWRIEFQLERLYSRQELD